MNLNAKEWESNNIKDPYSSISDFNPKFQSQTYDLAAAGASGVRSSETWTDRRLEMLIRRRMRWRVR